MLEAALGVKWFRSDSSCESVKALKGFKCVCSNGHSKDQRLSICVVRRAESLGTNGATHSIYSRINTMFPCKSYHNSLDQTVCYHNILHTNVNNEYTLGLVLLVTTEVFFSYCQETRFRFLTIRSSWNDICFFLSFWYLNIFFVVVCVFIFVNNQPTAVNVPGRRHGVPARRHGVPACASFVQNSTSIFWIQKLLWPNIIIVHWKPFYDVFTCQSMFLKCHWFMEGNGDGNCLPFIYIYIYAYVSGVTLTREKVKNVNKGQQRCCFLSI